MTDKEVMRQALAALQSNCPEFVSGHRDPVDSFDGVLVAAAITALQAAIDAPAQEPIGYLWERPGYCGELSTDKGPKVGWTITPLHAHSQPPPTQAQPVVWRLLNVVIGYRGVFRTEEGARHMAKLHDKLGFFQNVVTPLYPAPQPAQPESHPAKQKTQHGENDV